MSLRIVPIGLREAQSFVDAHHRHHEPPRGHKFSIGVADDTDTLVGVAIVGRPVSRVLQAEGTTLEVVRTATDGSRNANSMLYGACQKAAFALGYDRLITYTQEGESGASLRAAGFRVIASRPARRGWTTPSRPRDAKGTDGVARTLWESGGSGESGTGHVGVDVELLGDRVPALAVGAGSVDGTPNLLLEESDLLVELVELVEGISPSDHAATVADGGDK